MSAARRVRTVRLTAESDALVRRGAILLEDALRTASLAQGVGPRLLLVRSLPVGVIRADRSPAELALALERRVAQLLRWAVYAGDPAAETAPVVYFHDDAEPCVALAARAASGRSVAAWFWRLAVPGHRPDAPRDDTLRTALERAGETSAGHAATLRIVDALAAAGGALDALLGALRWQDGRALLRSLGWDPSTPAAARIAPVGAHPERLAPPRLLGTIARWSAMWGADDARSLWLAAMALSVDRPALLADPALPGRAARLLSAIGRAERAASISAPPARPTPDDRAPARPTPDDRAPARPTPDDRAPLEATPGGHAPAAAPVEGWPAHPAAGAPAIELARGAPVLRAPAAPVHSVVAARDRGGDTPAPPGAAIAEEPAPESASPWLDSPRPTALGGLLFLIPVLAQIGIAARLERDPELYEVHFAERALARVGERLGVPRGEPMLVALGAARLPPASPALLAQLDELRAEARRWCRRRARIGLRDLVVRPGRVVATKTHVDVLFDLNDADLRVRRVGLDIDPGWVPWLGRVVRFHYLPGERLDL
ncbi:hypothetical protein [Sorangium sp. So ce388]|uniref:hypothetical protein n=1 Tax=Sorangium sp. So ce388 TaxID=3133309 RepID=UPI003F5C40FE